MVHPHPTSQLSASSVPLLRINYQILSEMLLTAHWLQVPKDFSGALSSFTLPKNSTQIVPWFLPRMGPFLRTPKTWELLRGCGHSFLETF